MSHPILGTISVCVQGWRKAGMDFLGEVWQQVKPQPQPLKKATKCPISSCMKTQ